MPTAPTRTTESNVDLVRPEELVAATMNNYDLQETITQRPAPIFFYPAGSYDGRPLRHFADLCDTFIYCDVALDENKFLGELQGMVGADLISEPEVIIIDGELGLGIDDHPEWLLRYLAPAYLPGYLATNQIIRQHGGPWGRQFRCAIQRKR